MKIVILEQPSLAALLTIVESIPSQIHSPLIFRGQADAFWGLEPGIFRKKLNKFLLSFLKTDDGPPTLEDRYYKLEQHLIDKFFSDGMPYLPPVQRNPIHDRVFAQHYGVPTRLLDWSRDPFVALFFATERWADDKDAAFFIVEPYRAPLFEDERKIEDENEFFLVEPPAIDRRIPAQKSVLTHQKYGEPNNFFVPMDEREKIASVKRDAHGAPTSFVKVIIPASYKKQIFKKLQHIGFDRRTLFPGLDGVGANIEALARMEEYW